MRGRAGRRMDVGELQSTLKSRLGSIVDLQEATEIEFRRADLQEKVKELVTANHAKLHTFFRTNDPCDTGTAAHLFSSCMIFYTHGWVTINYQRCNLYLC